MPPIERVGELRIFVKAGLVRCLPAPPLGHRTLGSSCGLFECGPPAGVAPSGVGRRASTQALGSTTLAAALVVVLPPASLHLASGFDPGAVRDRRLCSMRLA